MAREAALGEGVRFGPVLVGLGTLAGYLLASRLGGSGHGLSPGPSEAWLASGVAVGTVLRFGAPALAGVVVGTTVLAVTTSTTTAGGLAVAARPLIEASAMVAISAAFGLEHDLRRARDALGLAISTLLTSALGAALAAGAIAALGDTPGGAIPRFFQTALGDALGILTVAPLLLHRWEARSDGPDARESLVSIALAGLCALVVFVGIASDAARASLAATFFPVLLVVAVRGGPGATALAVALTSAVALIATRLGLGPYAGGARSLGEGLGSTGVVLQVHQAVASLGALVVAGTVADRRRRDGLLAGEARAASLNEDRQKLLETQLRQAQKMEAVGTLAGGIAHDFNNVLTAVLGNVEFSLEAPGVPQEVREALQDVRIAGARARALVRRLSTISRREEPRLELLDVGALLREVADLLRATLPASIHLTVDVPKGAVPLPADGAQLHQALVNLGMNAAHAMRGQGELTMGVRAVSLTPAEARARHVSLRPDDYVRVRVSDTGHGMSAATRERIFEPFFTTKAPGEGTGLGLAVVHGIVDGHKGAILVESEIGEGSTFDLYFPASSRKFVPAVEELAQSPSPLKLRVLLVDDDPLVLAALGRSLLRAGCRVTAVSTPEEALALLRGRPDDYDVLLTDLSMPGMTGLELARAALVRNAALPIIAITGYLDPSSDEELRGSGVREVLTKPFSDAELVGAVRRHEPR